MRIAIGGFQHETNTFAPSKATAEQFVRDGGWPGLRRAGEILDTTVTEPRNDGEGELLAPVHGAAENVQRAPQIAAGAGLSCESAVTDSREPGRPERLAMRPMPAAGDRLRPWSGPLRHVPTTQSHGYRMLEELKNAARKAGAERALRGALADCRRLLSERGAANSAAIAHSLVTHFSALPGEQQSSFFERLSRDFSPDPKAVLQSAQAYADDPSAPNLLRLTQLTEPPRQELLRRINRSPGGTSSIIAMRSALLARLGAKPELQALEADLLHLLSSWFNPGFLQLQRVDWNSPAQLLEQLIHHEAVHQIDGWDDLRRRLQPDRRCFAFFHPQLPESR